VSASELVATLLEEAPPRARESPLHGELHWARVAAMGARLLADAPPADPRIVLAFALVHDARRENEHRDPAHGPRAAAWVADHGELLGLEGENLERLRIACELHTDGGLSDDPTIAVCFDADRLCLWRVGIEPDPRLLSTPAARRPDSIAWARRLQGLRPTWEQLEAFYGPRLASPGVEPG
jgi:uncharacterized protein